MATSDTSVDGTATDADDEVQETDDAGTDQVTEDDADADVETDEDVDDDSKFDKDRAIAKIRKANAEARNLRREVKRLREIENKVKAEDDAKKSELDKAIERAEAAEARLKDAQRETAVLSVKERFDLPAKVLAGLEGDSLDELIASAEEWASELGIEDKTKTRKRKTTEARDLDGGRKPGDRAPDGRTVATVVDSLELWR